MQNITSNLPQGLPMAKNKTSQFSGARITALSALLLALLGLACAHVLWQAYVFWYQPSKSVRITYTAHTSIQTESTNVKNYADDIASAHLFGRPLTPSNTKKITTEEMPESMLKVTIKGILALADNTKSMAILSIENTVDKVFKVGEELKPGHHVDQIVAQGVVVDHNGRLEMIRLPRASLGNLTAKAQSANRVSAAGLGQLRTEVLKNPLELEQHITFVPHTQNGQFAGYRVNKGSNPELFVLLGLQANDIVTSVDGVGIGQLAGRMDILTNLSIAENVRLGIIRNEQQQQLLVDFSQ